jgi:hypothetical protein
MVFEHGNSGRLFLGAISRSTCGGEQDQQPHGNTAFSPFPTIGIKAIYCKSETSHA